MASEAEVRVASEAKDEVIAASEGPVTLITKAPMSLWPLNAASDLTIQLIFPGLPILLLRSSNPGRFQVTLTGNLSDKRVKFEER